MGVIKELELDKFNHLRIAKFEKLIEDINEIITPPIFAMNIDGKGRNTPLNILFEDCELNLFGKTILEKAAFCIGKCDGRFKNTWLISFARKDKNLDKREAAKAFVKYVEYCDENRNEKDEGYKLVFWALMIVSVEDDLNDDKLSMICDLIKMLKLSDDEVEDIIYTIKNILNQVEDFYVFKTWDIPKGMEFHKVFEKYGNKLIKCSGCESLIISKSGHCEICGCDNK